ncbi:MAG: DUF1350 family protein [Synechococcales bacterium]|nr:DUF1350 family protein [Synechococcales bacterium]
MDWQAISGNWLLVPSRPRAIVHFLGGAFVAGAPQITYRLLLEHLAHQGYAVVATPFINTMDHVAIARSTLLAFEGALDYLQEQILRQRYLPVYGLGHSMGCKLHLLICSLFEVERAGNIFISFNNFPARRSIPFLEQANQFSTVFEGMRQSFPLLNQFAQVSPMLDAEFVPSPDETNQLIADRYAVRRNLLIKFRQDDIDQTLTLNDVLQLRFPDLTTFHILPGNHLTPLGQDVTWQSGDAFSPIDALGQFVRQEFYRDLHQLKLQVLRWLDPVTFDRKA